ncbi:stealth conserved region 3 domain-containing protein [Phaeovulum sp. NW3]|uniref:stealth conserved region 3 domain-containing protein n=1 Tax=Phaeovulum sp. NW3 TaxID=2934933 RepID=UPI0020219F69|nr:stealth conserved region 3 domain-containing protein [Phaeovulum sp. NW3]MCL7465845.1 stealth family protein [Phaeovulum sp. NW3]
MSRFRSTLGFARTGRLARLWSYLRVSLEQPQLLQEAAARVRHSRRSRRTSLRAAAQPPEPAPLSLAEAASADVVLARLASHFPVLVLELGEDGQGCGLAEKDFALALGVLRRLVPGLQITAQGRILRPRAARKALQIGRVLATLPPAPGTGARERLWIESYERRGPGDWLSRNGKNQQARALFTAILDKPGLHRIEDILGAPTLAAQARQAPVDVVFTWVNHDDPDWQKQYRAHRPDAEGSGAGSADGAALSRFHSNDELRFSLRSVARNMAWVNRIFVFTNCAPPDWFDPAQQRLVWVPHDAVIPAPFLPTFNSHVIESFLHRIPGLAERFVYLNDDVFIGRRLPKTTFFVENGISRAFLEGYGMVSGPAVPGDPDYRNAARTSAALIRETLGFAPTRLHLHAPFALRRDVLEEIEQRFAGPIAAMRQNRFRAMGDLNIPSFLYHHYAIGTGRALPAEMQTLLVKNHDIRWRARLAAIAQDPPQTFCLNEGGAAPPTRAWHREVRRVLGQVYPDPAPWERQSGRSKDRIDW